jgi:hypothetical protein
MIPGWYIRRRGFQEGGQARPHWLDHADHWTTNMERARHFATLAEAESRAWRDNIVRLLEDGTETLVIRDIRAPLRTLRISPRPRIRRIPPVGGRGPDGRPSWSTTPPTESTQ